MDEPRAAFRCLTCRAPRRFGATGCDACGTPIMRADGIPVLLPDPAAIDRHIADARATGRGKWYDGRQDAQWSGPYRHHLRRRRAYVDGVLADHRRTIPADLRALDLGCGDGGNIPWLARHADELLASDYNLSRVGRADAERAHVFVADATDYPVADDQLDLVFCNHVLEHIPDDAGALREVARILRPGGLLVLGIPNEGAAFWRLAYRLEPRTRRRTDHVHFYTADEITRRCEAAGLAVDHVERIGWGVPHWTADSLVRRFRVVDDAFEHIGRRWLPEQATSLYVLARKHG